MSRRPNRIWQLQGATNFRDLGGYAGADGREVRWRRLFRSDHLGGLTAKDHAVLAELGLNRSFDFRGRLERGATPYELPGVVQHSLAIEPTVVQRMQSMAAAECELSGPVVVELMKDLYRSLVDDQSHRFAEFFQQLLRADGPVVFHCTAGKDRTGVAAALLLALGVSRELVMQDYLLTNELLRPPLSSYQVSPEALDVLWRVQESFLEAAFDAIETHHGGIDQYLTHRLGLTTLEREGLADRYLES